MERLVPVVTPIDFLLSAKRSFPKASHSPNHPRPRTINVEWNPAYPRAIDELRRIGELGRRCRCRRHGEIDPKGPVQLNVIVHHCELRPSSESKDRESQQWRGVVDST